MKARLFATAAAITLALPCLLLRIDEARAQASVLRAGDATAVQATAHRADPAQKTAWLVTTAREKAPAEGTLVGTAAARSGERS